MVKSAAAQKEHFLSCAVSSHFLVLFVEFFLGKLPKTGFFAQCHESDIIARFVVFRFRKFRYDDTKERLAAACPALPDAEKQQGGIHLHFIDADGSFTLERTLKAAGVRAALASALRGGFPSNTKGKPGLRNTQHCTCNGTFPL